MAVQTLGQIRRIKGKTGNEAIGQEKFENATNDDAVLDFIHSPTKFFNCKLIYLPYWCVFYIEICAAFLHEKAKTKGVIDKSLYMEISLERQAGKQELRGC